MAPTCEKVRRSGPAHAAALSAAMLGPPFNGQLPERLQVWTALPSMMPAP